VSDLHARVAAAQHATAARPSADEQFLFLPATKAQAKARLALAGPSGSGKTYTALKIATALGGQIGCLDTEHGSAAKYANLFGFGHQPFAKPYDPRRLIRALAAAGSQGIEVLIIDSLSHFWQGAGGMLDVVDGAARRNYGGNTWSGWKDANPIERDLIEAMLAFPGHLIVTMRVKTEYVVEENDKGKKAPRKVGLKPVQRDGLEYEFDVVGDLDLGNTLTISKSRCPALSGAVIHQPGLEVGQQLLTWLQDGAPARTAAELRAAAADPAATRDQLLALLAEAETNRLLEAAVLDEAGQTLRLGEFIIRCGQQAAARTAQLATVATGPAATTVPLEQGDTAAA
jgi:hypothetical protein